LVRSFVGMARSFPSRIVLAALLGAALLLAGCGGGETDKAGGAAGREPRVLRLANFNPVPGELEPFAREVERASQGRLRIEFVNDWRKGEPDAEPGVLDDVRAGKVDLAWVGARAFKAEGVRALDPLVAPFEVMDYATEAKVLGSPIAGEMLDAVDKVGVRGVAILPGPLQRLGMREPWNNAADLDGKRIGAPAGIGGEAVKALGAHPVAVASGGELTGVDGSAQLHLTAYLANRYARTIPHVATDAFWPRPLVVIAGPQAWGRLSEADRHALVEAGRLAAGPVLDAVRDGERSAIPQLCRQGARFFQADVADLRRAVEPVYAAIRRDGTAARVLEAIEGMRSPDAGDPIACPADDKTAAAGLPTGSYTWTITRAEALRMPGIRKQPDFLAEMPAVFRAVIKGGHIVIYVSSKGAEEEIGYEADISVFEDRVEFDDGTGADALTARWSVERGDLRFSDVSGDAGGQVVMETKPWRKVR
jgi:TRAP-type C4-dicarboxylate transport system substrate-binding protein